MSIEIEIESIAYGGRGIGRYKGKVVFVPKTAPGDIVTAKIVKEKSRYSDARLLEVITPSKLRIESQCPYFLSCGGCSFLHLPYSEQINIKEAFLRNAIRNIADDSIFIKMIPSILEIGYRHRGEFHIICEENVNIGFFRELSHDIVDINSCLHFSKPYFDKYLSIKNMLKEFIIAKKVFSFELSSDDNEKNFALCLNMKASPDNIETDELKKILNEINLSGLAILYNGKGEILGNPMLSYKINMGGEAIKESLQLFYDVRGFSQVSFTMNQMLVEKVLEIANIASHETVLDLYCGNGNFTIPISKSARDVIGVESSKESILCGKEGARVNGITNIVWMPLEAERAVETLIASSKRFSLVVLDPPRMGALNAVNLIPRLEPDRIIYVSCSPPTFERDANILKNFGYKLESITGIDLSPQTYSIESVALFKK